jgi:hypothetical protein
LICLEDYECVEADDGYIGEAPMYVCCHEMVTFDDKRRKIKSCCTAIAKKQSTKASSQLEILNVPFCSDISMHLDIFVAIA